MRLPAQLNTHQQEISVPGKGVHYFVVMFLLIALSARASPESSSEIASQTANTPHQTDAIQQNNSEQTLPDSATPSPLSEKPDPAQLALMDREFTIPPYDLHFLTDEIKQLLDVEVTHVRSKKQRFLKLHDVLYKSHYLNLMYNPNGTYTAAETFRQGSGNCMSHANLFVAAARYVGLKAYYQSVEVPLEWRPRQGFYELPGHVNVVLKLGHYNATVEFNQAIFDEYDMTSLKKEIISDDRAKAEFYNNLGVEALNENQYFRAIAFFEKAIETDKKLDISWSNLGVVHKKLGAFNQAEQAYLKAIALNPHNKSAMKNLFVLYTQIGDEHNAETYRKDVEKYARKNPYYLEKLAKRELALKNFDKATRLFKKAIRIYKLEPSFYHGLALSYYHQNKIDHAKKALDKAQQYADLDDKQRYSQKLQVLTANNGI
ncbi:Photosystem I assembly protein Ycf3 [Thalassocella blandensis]|nr:Photosystem I assembly protein Ycf3 [Thalassocella blandensis]